MRNIGDRDIDIGVIPPGQRRKDKPYAGDNVSFQVVMACAEIVHPFSGKHPNVFVSRSICKECFQRLQVFCDSVGIFGEHPVCHAWPPVEREDNFAAVVVGKYAFRSAGWNRSGLLPRTHSLSA